MAGLVKWRRADRLYRTWVKARKAQRVHLHTIHPDGVLDCVCERSVWYFAKRKSIGIFSINWGRPCICQPTD